MATKTPGNASNSVGAVEKSYFEQQRDLLMRDVGVVSNIRYRGL